MAILGPRLDSASALKIVRVARRACTRTLSVAIALFVVALAVAAAGVERDADEQRATTAPVAQAARFTPVTDAMLARPSPADWLNWRRTLDGWGYSPLDQINTKNVHQLQLAWSWGLTPETESADSARRQRRHVRADPGGGAQALDAATGELLWEYQRTSAPGTSAQAGPMRSLAIFGDKVFVATADAHLVALNARTGAVVWDQQVADREAGLPLLQRSDRREERRRRRHHRLPAVQERHLLHLGPRQ